MVRFPAEWRQTVRSEGAGMPDAFVYPHARRASVRKQFSVHR